MEEQTQQSTKKKLDLSTYGLVVGFLCLEVLAFVSFYLGHSFNCSCYIASTSHI